MQETRDILQNRAIDTFLRHHRLILNWGTGVGKSRVAIRSLDILNRQSGCGRFLLLVVETAHKMNWRNEFVEALGAERASELLSCVTIECYASLAKFIGTEWDVIVMDEAHRLRSELRQGYISTMTAKGVLCLSATISDHGDGEDMLLTLERTFGRFQVMSMSIQEAIDNEILPEPSVIVHSVTLWNDDVKESYTKLCEYNEKTKKEYFSAKFQAGLGEDEETEETEELKAKWLSSGLRRKTFLGAVKTSTAAYILKDFEKRGLKYICFCSSIKQAQRLSGKVESDLMGNFISSKRSSKDNLAVIERFNAGCIHSIFAVSMIQEGQNLRGIEAGLIIQTDGKARGAVQKIGRVMRSKHPEIHILCIPETRDEEYVSTALEGLSKDFITGWPLQSEMFDSNGEKRKEKEIHTAPEEKPEPEEKTVRPGFEVLHIRYSDGSFGYSTESEQTFKFSSISGTFCGVAIEKEGRGEVCKFLVARDKDRILNSLVVPKPLSLGLLMPLANCRNFNGKRIRITVKEKNGWPSYGVEADGQPLDWLKISIPKKQDSSQAEREAFYNSMIRTINKAV